MAGSRTTFEKLQRDRAKKAKADAKRAKRMGKTPESGPLVYEEAEPIAGRAITVITLILANPGPAATGFAAQVASI